MSEWNLSDPDQRSQAAADYVLGLLDKTDKARFEALLAMSHDAQQDIQHWREHLDILNDQLEPVKPPARVWQKISEATRPAGLWSSLRFWQGLGASGFAAAMMLAVTFWITPPETIGGMDYVYVVQGSGSQTEWIVNASLEKDMVYVEAIQPDELPEGKACELWLMVAGREPVSLGLLPKQGMHQIPISPEWREAVKNSPLVITLEGMQGAPNGFDMGPVVTKGQWTPINKHNSI